MSMVALRSDETASEEPMQLRDHPLLKQSGHILSIDPRKLKVDPSYNVRDMESADTKKHIAWLKDLIIANDGVHTALEVRLGERDQIFIVAGHCRQAAAVLAMAEGHPLKTVPIVQEARGTSEEDRIVNLVVSNSGKALTLLEVAKVVKRLGGYGWTDKQIAERLGWKSTKTVTDHLEALGLSEPVKDHVRKGDISATSARHLAKSELTPEQQAALIASNLAQNKQIKGKRARVTPRQIKKATARKPKPEGPASLPVRALQTDVASLANVPEPIGDSELTASAAIARTDTPDDFANLHQRTLAQVEQQNGWHPDAVPDPLAGVDVAPTRAGVKELIAALEPFATLAHEFDFNARSDDETIEVPIRHLKQAWIVFARVCGEAT